MKSPLQRCVYVAKFLAEVISDLDENMCSLLIYRCAVAWFKKQNKNTTTQSLTWYSSKPYPVLGI